MQRQIQTFEVSLKAFIIDRGRALLLQEADTGYWELPGGRIDVGEEWSQHGDILARELAEELGHAFTYTIGREAVSWVRQRPTDQVFQFVLARVCGYHEGPVAISDEHANFGWFEPAEWNGLSFPPLSGYQGGLQALRSYVKS